jgi:hypothetical protein
MRTNLKVILATIGIAALASPVMAQTGSTSNARGSAAHIRTIRAGTATPVEGSQIRLDDCVHVTFPQCGGDSTQSQVDRP